MSALAALITEFAAGRGIDPPALDPSTGGYALAIGARYLVHLHEIGSEIVARAWLDDLPEEEGRRSEVVRRLLKRELARFGEDDLVLSIDEAAGELRLHRRVSGTTLDARGLDALLQSLIDGVERRRGMVRGRTRSRPVAPMIIRP